MILDRIENKDCYVAAHPLFREAFAFIEEYLKNPGEPGTYEICGTDLYAKVQDYETREEGAFEVHDRYIDIQFMVDGVEKVEYVNRKKLGAAVRHNVEADVLFFKDGEDCVDFLLTPGEFAIFFPDDAHKPSQKAGTAALVRKMVLKVKVK